MRATGAAIGGRLMPWLKSEGKFPKNDKVWELSDAAYRLYDAARHYATEHLTDGHVPISRVSALTPKPATNAQKAALIRANLWHLLPDICASCTEMRKKRQAAPLPRSGYVVHDYLVYNPSRSEYERDQEKRRVAGQLGGLAKGQRHRSASGMLSTEPSSELSTTLSTELEHPERGAPSSMLSSAPAPYSRTPVPGAIAPVPTRARDHVDADRSRDRATSGATGERPMRHIGGTAARVARQAGAS